MAKSSTKKPLLAKRVRLRIPASTSNLGAGFDCLGLAVGLCNVFTLEPNGGRSITVQAKGSVKLDEIDTRVGSTNLVWRSAGEVFRRAGVKPPGMRIRMEIGVPPGRGLGSSATAIIAGVAGANALLGSPLSDEEVFNLVVALEGHPDNAAACFYGGLTAAVLNKRAPHVIHYRAHSSIRAVVTIPPNQLSTQKARAALPSEVAHADAVHNLTRVPFVIRALTTGTIEDLAWAADDRLHEPYRLALSRNGRAIRREALAAGAACVSISGSGPSLVAFCLEDKAEAVAEAMRGQLRGGDALVLKVENKGLRLTVKA